MLNECDLCGLPDSECHCYMQELEERISILEEGLDEITYAVEKIMSYLRKIDDVR